MGVIKGFQGFNLLSLLAPLRQQGRIDEEKLVDKPSIILILPMTRREDGEALG